MKNSKVINAVLLVSALIATVIGGAIVMLPSAFYATYGIELGGDVSLLNEIRAPFNCLDRHVNSGRGDQPALIYDSAYTGQKKSIAIPNYSMW